MATEAKKPEAKKEKKTVDKSKFVKPAVAWTLLALELCAAILIGVLVCRG